MFALLADIQDHEPLPLDAQVKMTKHPSTATRVGTRWDERVKIAPGWWMSIESIVTDIRPPSVLGMDFHSAWLYGRLTYAITPSAGGAMLHQVDVSPMSETYSRRPPEMTPTVLMPSPAAPDHHGEADVSADGAKGWIDQPPVP